MWGMSSDQVYSLLDDLIFAMGLVFLAAIGGIVWIRIDAHDCVCECGYSKDPEAEEETSDVETDMSEAPSPVVGLPVPGTKGDA